LGLNLKRLKEAHGMTISESSTVNGRISGCFLGLAVGDALGMPVEFQARGTFQPVTEMCAGGYFRLPLGAWTDDTAMALCLGQSLTKYPQFDPKDLLDRFCRWMYHAENTSTGKCIGIGQNTLRTLGHYYRTGELVASPNIRSDGNGAIMRLAPVACIHFKNPILAKQIAVSQGKTTHASALSDAACELLSDILCELIAGHDWDAVKSRIPSSYWPKPIADIATGSWQNKSSDEISSSGFVADTLEAACWAVGTSNSFEQALINAVNLGNDADTVGAVTGQIAGARYGLGAIPSRWLNALAERESLERLCNQFFTADKA